MGRPAKFSDDLILDATAEAIARHGPAHATVASIAAALGAPSGSIYHRFDSRDLMFARLWIRTVRRAQPGFIEALANPVLEIAARDAALHVPRWSRSHLSEAMVLLLYRREDLAARWPDELGGQLRDLNVDLVNAYKSYCRRRYGTAARPTLETVRFALFDIPYAGVRPYLAACESPPLRLDELIATAATSVLDAHHPAGSANTSS
jgi:AcrR family transcriptional regulator